MTKLPGVVFCTWVLSASVWGVPIAFQELAFLVRHGEQEQYIGQQLKERGMASVLTEEQLKTLRKEGASERLLRVLSEVPASSPHPVLRDVGKLPGTAQKQIPGGDRRVPDSAAPADRDAADPGSAYWRKAQRIIGQNWYLMTDLARSRLPKGDGSGRADEMSAEFTVDTSGVIGDLKVTSKPTSEAFAEVTMQAIRQTRLPPPPASLLDATTGKTKAFPMKFRWE